MSRTAHPFAAPVLRLLGLVILLASLTGCASVRDSRANPFNWFGGGDPVIVRTDEVGPEPAVNPLIPERRASIFRNNSARAYSGTLVSQVTELQVERLPGASVIRATGIASSLGAFDVRLIPVESAQEETLRFELRARQAASTRGQGTEAARTVTVALSLSDQTLAAIRTIEVVSEQNQRSVRR
jgi:hypothetical protein